MKKNNNTDMESSNKQSPDKTRRNFVLGAATVAGAGLVSGQVGAAGFGSRMDGRFNDQLEEFCNQHYKPFKGKCAFVTGGARGIGRGCAEMFAENGADVVIYDVASQIETVKYQLANQEDLYETQAAVEAQGVRCLIIQGDTRDRFQLSRAMEEAVSTFGSLDFVIGNAGITQIGELDTFTDEEVQTVQDVNLGGTIKTIQAATPILKNQESGRIVLTSSITGRAGTPLFPVYSATKWGVISLAKSTALALGRYNITCNAICPDLVHTKLLDNPYVLGAMGIPSFDTMHTMARDQLHALPVGAFQPSDVAKTVRYLCSDDAAYISGDVFDIAGGSNASNLG